MEVCPVLCRFEKYVPTAVRCVANTANWVLVTSASTATVASAERISIGTTRRGNAWVWNADSLWNRELGRVRWSRTIASSRNWPPVPSCSVTCGTINNNNNNKPPKLQQQQ